MLKLLLISTLRLIRKDKVLSFVKIFGLAIGTATFLLTTIFTIHELNFDRQHPDAENIYRYVHRVVTPEGLQSFSFTSATTGPALRERFPEVESFTRIFFTNVSLRNPDNDVAFNEKRFAFADSNFTTTFNFPLQAASAPHVLDQPLSVILSPASAEKYFGKADPVGKTLIFNGTLEFVVKGVFAENFNSTHFDFDFIASFSSLETIRNHPVLSQQIPASINLETKGFAAFYTYLKLTPGTAAELEAKFPSFIEEFRGPGRSERLKPSLQKLTDIHLKSEMLYEIDQNGNYSAVIVYFVVGLLILFIGCINYINITTAEFINRTRGIGLKKILGISRLNLVVSQIVETSVFAGFSIVTGYVIAIVALPFFTDVVSREIKFFQYTSLLILFGIFILIVLIAGIYPALAITRQHALQSLKGAITRTHGSVISVRNGLVFFQLFMSYSLMALSLLIYSQINFLLNKETGFASDQIIVMDVAKLSPGTRNGLKNSLLDKTGILGITQCSLPPGETFFTFGVTLKENSSDEDRRITMYQSFVDSDYLTTLGIHVEEGRFFSGVDSADSAHYIVVNRAAADAIGGNVLNREIEMPDIFKGTRSNKTVVGIISDFHFASFHQKIDPLILELSTGKTRYMLARFSARNTSDVIKAIESTWRSTINDAPFDYYFLDERYASLYENDQRTKKIIGAVSMLAIGLAALGIFGTTLFNIQSRVKEVGIRKVLGAEKPSLLALLFKPMFLTVLSACMIAVPAALSAGQQWLAQYPYRAGISPWLFIVSFIIILVIVSGTTLYHFVKVTRLNPTEVLRRE